MKKIRVYSIVSVIAVVVVSLVLSVTVLAEAGDEGGGGKRGCAPAGSSSYWDTCYGGAWKYYPAESDSIAIPGRGSVEGGTVTGCAKYGGYYRLALEHYNPQTGASLGDQVGLWQVYRFDMSGGTTAYRSDLPGAVTWDDALNKFNQALAHNATNGHSWNEVSWFCYDMNWSSGVITPVPPRPSSANGEFWSTSAVTVFANGDDIPSDISVESDKDSTARIKISTDQDHVRLNFSHTMHYTNEVDFDTTIDETATPTSTWTVTNIGASQSSNPPSDTWGAPTFTEKNHKYGLDDSANDHDGDPKDRSYLFSSHAGVSATGIISVDIPVGNSPTTICYRINYNNKYITLTSTDKKHTITKSHGDGDPPSNTPHAKDSNTDLDYKEWKITSTAGAAGSMACVEVTRPADPTGDVSSSGISNNTIKFAGEDSTIGWNTSAVSLPVRRIVEWQAVAYEVPVTQNHYGGITSGNIGSPRQSLDVCSYYGGKNRMEWCGVIGGRSSRENYGPVTRSHNYNESEKVVVSDHVGYKYCNSFGYQFEYYYATSSNPSKPDEWHSFGQNYWKIYDAACRTIAKKPSVAIWNGSTLTNSSVTTSLSYRYDNAVMGAVSSSGGSRTNYGSWSEYLNVIGSTLSGFTSGAALSDGYPNDSDIYPNSSRLTITNNTTNLGGSGVQTNSTLRTRMVTYLRNQAEPLGDTLAGLTTSTTRIFHRKGDLYITGDIILSPTHYATIYQLPQVVIFVDGNVYIDSNVNRIDAWIIAGNENTGTGGVIDTCRQFAYGSTEADALNRMLPGGNNCAKQLVFNGPVFANKLLLHRSFGSDPIAPRDGAFAQYRLYSKGSAGPTKYNPAEIFNLNANTYLWAYAQAGRYESSYTESYSRELAPRY